ncbi:antimicrobial peptide system SdpA family protein [Streptomyces sp. TLI_55]|uniref:SdpA family antimicrobial peptide system protein n=1 Tax=Streptomyces sp. TLI_55 TaxID=1938861 RepID=UPI000BC976D5|nr:SdpA family antimicrobial peptide system protein [Streptomyces sp. TLI_55]SNX62861.1 antimicrobial peptide system SdpA family protein [Streptomyces sp. TLI_55]
MRLTDSIQLRSHRPGHSVAVPHAWVAAITVVWVIVCLYVAQSFLPHNAISLPGQGSTKKVATVVAPQGWAFFTKSAKDPQYAPYRMTGGGWHSAALTPHSRPSNVFGLDRASRSQGIEVALLLHQKNVRWTSCEETTSVMACLEHAAPRATATTNPSPAPTLCGRAAVAEMRPVPWAWRDLSPERHTPERVAVWDVRCP